MASTDRIAAVRPGRLSLGRAAALVCALAVAGCGPDAEAPPPGTPADRVSRFAAGAAPRTDIPPRFETLTVEDGLSSTFARELLQDRQGFIWIATSDGLNRFDGAAVTVFAYDPDDPRSLGDDNAGALFEDRSGRIWVGTETGASRFDPATETFTRFAHDPDDPASLGAGAATVFAEDTAGTLYAGTWGGGLNRFDPATETFTRFTHDPADSTSLPHDNVYALAPAPDGSMWVGTATGIARIALPTRTAAGSVPGAPARVPVDLSAFGGPNFITGYSLLLDRSGMLWIGTFGRGLVRFDPETGDTRNYPAGPDGLGHPWVLAMTEDASGTIWVGTDGGGLHRYDASRDAFDRFTHDPVDPSSLADDRVLSIAEDRTGVLWVGTARGLCRRLPLSTVVAQERHRPGDPQSLSADDVTAFVEDASGALYVGTDGGGLNRRDPATGVFTRVPLGGPGQPTADDGAVINLAADEDGTVWVSTYSGLFRGRGLGPFRPFVTTDSTGAPVVLRAIQALLVPSAGRLWVGSQYGLYSVDVSTGRSVYYRPMPSDSTSNVAQSVYALLPGPGGALWVAGFPATLNRFEPGPGTFTDVRAAHGGAAPTAAVASLMETRDGSLWAGTGAGLEHQDGTGPWRRYGRNEGLPNASINGLLEGPEGGIWVATNRGVSRLDPATGHVRSYGASDGLQGEISNLGAFYASPRTGTFYLGGERGYNAFDPLALPAEAPPAAPVLTRLEISGEAVAVAAEGSPLPRALSALPRVRLRYTDRVVTLTFASLDFRAPSAHRYAVRLDGLDDDWREVGAQRQATFTNLSPGRYTFHARAAGRDGVWGATSAPLTLVVVPPWWRSWAALILYVLLAAGGLGAVARVRRQRADLRQQMRVDQIEAQKLRELDRAKSQFFANVSHEFRTPLTLTMGPLDDVLAGEYGSVPDPVAAPLRLARRSAGRVLDLINQILEVSRLEAGRTPLRARRLDLAAFVAAHVEAFRPLAVHRTLAVEVGLPEGPVEVWADPDHAGTVLANLLSNAFKFTPAHGTVRITVGADADAARVTVRDSGPGIEAADLPHIFDRFYQASRSGDRPLGSGIGLALAHNLAALHGGTLSVESEPGAGSAFTVTLPLGRAHLAADQLADGPWDATAPAALPDLADLSGEATDDTDDDDVTTVLVADDHADIRAYLRRHLAAAGYRVLEAANGTEALAVVRSRLPDLVVSDVMMPGLDGLGLCRALRADPETDFVPVLLLTARAAAEDRLSGLAELCDDYLTKPFDARELVARVGNLIALRRRLRTRFGGDGAIREVAAPASPDAPVSSDDAFLATVRAAIEAHLGDDSFDVGALADAVGHSRSQLLRRTRAAAGVSPSNLIRTTRLDRAADLLAARAGTVSEVAYGVGFKSVAHFSNAFLAHTGARPSAYAEAGT